MRPFQLVLAALFALSTSALARPQEHLDRSVQGGQVPEGWSVRLDRPNATMESVKVVRMGNGLHVTLGPAIVLYREGDRASGVYRAAASFAQTEPTPHPEAYGLFIGGSDLQAADQGYTYFLVRQDGKFLVKRRQGGETKTLVDWTAHDAVKAVGGEGGGSVTNELAIDVGSERVAFLVNGTQVASLPRGEVDAEGICGYRVNHRLDLHLGPLSVTKGVGE